MLFSVLIFGKIKNMKYLRKSLTTAVVLIVVGSGFYLFKDKAPKPQDGNSLINNQSKNMIISSSIFQNNGEIPKKYTCEGEGINPPLEFSGIPSEAKSLVLIMDDPDAPMSDGFVHWVVFNMNPTISGIAENMKPESGTEGTGSSGKQGYVSPCPPSGTHHYHFKLYALNDALDLNSSVGRNEIEKAMEGKIVGQAELIGLYQKQQ